MIIRFGLSFIFLTAFIYATIVLSTKFLKESNRQTFFLVVKYALLGISSLGMAAILLFFFQQIF